MTPYEFILAKREGRAHRPEEIEAFLDGFLSGEIPDYQVAAWCMAVFFRGLAPPELTALTLAMARSGRQLDLSGLPGRVVDKHSTGGVGDKTTLILAPLVAAGGVPVAKLSGRALGHTGGTLDKLEAIPGFRTDLSPEELLRVAGEVGVAVAGATADLAPADKRLYALRDVTATVDSLPLIAASVMAKKLAGGAAAIVLDVKTGSGAFLPRREQAVELARAMVAIGREAGRETVAYVTDMSQPLGRAVGAALEVEEAVRALQGEGPEDLMELVTLLAGEMLALGGRAPDREAGRQAAARLLASGAALDRFRRWVAAQGGDPRVADDPRRLPRAPVVRPVPAPAAGRVAAIDGRELGLAVVALGGGRRRQHDPVDPAVGLVVAARIGDPVQAGAPLAWVHARDAAGAEAAVRRVQAAFTVAEAGGAPPPLVYERVA